jgi:hypothetical protein
MAMSCIRFSPIASLLATSLLCAGGPAYAAAPPDAPPLAGSPTGPWRRLFLDAMVVEQQNGLERLYHAAEKHPSNPILKADKPWEGNGYGTAVHGGTVLLDGGRLRMWYIGGRSRRHVGYRICYAESGDGLAWTKPALGMVDFRNSKDNNIVLDDQDMGPDKNIVGYTTFVSVIKLPHQKDPARRYALYCYYHCVELTTKGRFGRFVNLAPRVAFSPDGLQWTFPSDKTDKGLFSSSDVVQFYRDPYQDRYYATWKASNRRGRAAGVAFSGDGLKWTKPVQGPVFVADDLDPDDTQIYGLSAFAYQGLYLGLPWIYHARWFKYGAYADGRMYEVERDSPCTMDAQLAWSWNLVNWTRPPARSPLIPLGKEGDFDAGMAIPAKEPVAWGDRLYFYYAGFPGRHNEAGRLKLAATGLATLRIDGFCSMHAGAKEGHLVTRRESLRRAEVIINAKAVPGGYVVAELLDVQNRVIPGFGRDDCTVFAGDSVRHRLTWKSRQFPPELRQTDKKIRFFLKNADLYSYLPELTP